MKFKTFLEILDSGKDVVVAGGKALFEASKSIGKSIVENVGKAATFMGEVAVGGTLAVMNIIPSVGSALADGLVAGTSALFGEDSPITAGVSSLMEFSKNVGSTAVNVFQNVTEGVVGTINAFSKTAAKKLGFSPVGASDNFFGSNSAFEKSFGSDSRFANITAKPTDLTKAFQEAEKTDPILNIDLTPFDVNAIPSSTDLESTVPTALGLTEQTLGDAVGVAEVAKPSLLQRGYEGAKSSVKKGAEAAYKAGMKEISEAPEKLLTEYVTGEVKQAIYGEPEEVEVPDYGNAYAGFASGNVVQGNTIQSYATPISPNQFSPSYQPRGNWGYPALQSTSYGQRMSQLYNPQRV